MKQLLSKRNDYKSRVKGGLILLGTMMLISLTGCQSDATFRHTGFVEADDVSITPFTSGALITLNIEEGAHVTQGDIIGQIDDSKLKLQYGALDYQIASLELSKGLMIDEIDDRDLANVNAQMMGVKAQLDYANEASQRALEVYDDAKSLYVAGGTSQEALDQAGLAYENAKSSVETLKAQLTQLTLNYDTLADGVDSRKLEQLDLSIKQLEQEKAVLEVQMSDCVLKAPMDGTVTALSAHAGAFYGQGTTLGTIQAIDKPYVIFYLDNATLSKVHIGDNVNVYLDQEETPKLAQIYFIADTAQFTPKNVTVKEDRQQLVYEVKAYLPSGEGFFPGQMVDITMLEE